ncbi:ABC transporter permease [Krasilnikoviella flava]|uniref:NitT/TauT family transport system permease protein n=1 Tax=Krasilnikoviella flava TaxID=526729 RepID=A0A1T5LGV0_9MICO|nr:ABC transporter permease [Krasilnikoviella flava]SKC75267.1 NitT/TauT family transport system permease protein [Krasilnikoviella flava]
MSTAAVHQPTAHPENRTAPQEAHVTSTATPAASSTVASAETPAAGSVPPSGPTPRAGSGRAAGRRRLAGAVAKVGPLLAAVAGIVAVWYVVTYLVLSPERRFLLPPLHQVLGTTLGNPLVMGPMLDALWQTVGVALCGLAIAVVLGIGYAVVMVQSGWAERILYPYAVILQTIPILALTPLIGIWMGYGFSARIVVCVIIALFPMIANTLFGLQSASPAAHDLFTLNRATRAQRLFKLQFPAALPSIFTGLRNAAGLSVIGAIVGDFFFQQGSPGIGGLLRTYTLRLNMDSLFMAIILTALFGVAMFSVFAALDRAVIGRWYGRSGA